MTKRRFASCQIWSDTALQLTAPKRSFGVPSSLRSSAAAEPGRQASANMFDASFVDRLFSTEWFSHCGNPLPPPQLPFACSQVTSWAEASALSSAIEWENTTLEARNELTDILHKSQANRMQDWNDITKVAKATIVFPLTEKFWTSFAEENGLGKPFIDCVQWDILAACMENAYRQPSFFTELLNVYRAGYFPCGWASGEYPNGNLVIW